MHNPMRTLFFAALPLLALAACSDDDEHRNAAAAVAAGFEPPTVLDRADFGSSRGKRFARLDLNGDSLLQPNEWPARYADRLPFAELDENADGHVTYGEYFETMMRRFDAADSNKDQVLTSEERESAGIPRTQTDNESDAADSDSGAAENRTAAR